VLSKCKVRSFELASNPFQDVVYLLCNPIFHSKENEMSYKILFVINAIVVAAFGLSLFLAPETGLAQFNMTARAQEIFMARVIGVTLASLGILLWFAKDAEGAAQKNLGMAALAGAVLGLIVTVIGLAGGFIAANGWIAIVVEVVFGLGYAFILFLQPRIKEESAR
jgi:hypothetical protein